jgi:hypothetical protein
LVRGFASIRGFAIAEATRGLLMTEAARGLLVRGLRVSAREKTGDRGLRGLVEKGERPGDDRGLGMVRGVEP